MENWTNHGVAAQGRPANILQEAGYRSMDDRKAKRTSKALDSSVNPAFDPITAALRQMHDDFASEPIPDDFMRLLDQIDARFAASKKVS